MAKNKQNSQLFFYGAADLLQHLKNGTLPLQSDMSLLSPYIEFDHWHRGKSAPVSQQEFTAELNNEYARLPDNVKLFLSYDDFTAQSDKLADVLNQRALANRTSDLKGYDTSRLQKTAFLRLFPVATSDYGWRVLAEDFSGLCLELSTQATLFKSQPGNPVRLQAVRYGERHSPAVDQETPVPGLFCHNDEYEKQQEWRAAFVTSHQSTLELKLPKGDVRAIYVSSMAAAELVESLRTFLTQDIRYKHVKLFEVFPDAIRWRLTARPFR